MGVLLVLPTIAVELCKLQNDADFSLKYLHNSWSQVNLIWSGNQEKIKFGPNVKLDW